MPYIFNPPEALTIEEVSLFIAAMIGVLSDDVYAQVEQGAPWLIPYLQAVPEE